VLTHAIRFALSWNCLPNLSNCWLWWF